LVDPNNHQKGLTAKGLSSFRVNIHEEANLEGDTDAVISTATRADGFIASSVMTRIIQPALVNLLKVYFSLESKPRSHGTL